jgi:gliding motility-associated-like protein
MKKHCTALCVCLILLNHLAAQLCTGSLGDPVVRITFGNSSIPDGPLKTGVTNMQYVSVCPNDGQYTIASQSTGCFNGTWFTFHTDHTGDAGGKVMLINGSLAPSDFYLDTVVGLCNNTTYELAAWVSNMLRSTACNGAGIKANLSFSIETVTGAVLQKFSSGDIPLASDVSWQQYGTFFTTPATGTASVVLRIRNNSNGGCGNDLMLDDITFRPCGPKVEAYADNDRSGSISFCENNNRDLHFVATYSAGYADPVLQWQESQDGGSTWTDIAGAQGSTYTRKAGMIGNYQYRVSIVERANFSSVSCRTASNITSLQVLAAPKGKLTQVTGCSGASKQIVADPGFTYQWTGPNGFSSTAAAISFPAIRYADSGLYQLNMQSQYCSGIDSFYLRVFPNAKAVAVGSSSACEGTGVTLSASGGVQYRWSPAAGLSDTVSASPLASPTDTTVYKVAVTNQYGCTDTASTAVNIWKKPRVDAGADQQIFSGESVMLHGTASGTAISFSWTPALFIQQGNTLTPTVSPLDVTTYTLAASSNLGCGIASDEVLVKVFKKIQPPNAFSPNGDGINDAWIIPGLDTYPESKLMVYDRTGSTVFSTVGSEKQWDGKYQGKPVPVATYYYVIMPGLGLPPVSGWVLVVR